MTKKEKKYKVFLPLIDGENAPTEQFVGFNGKAYRIKRGEEVEVPVGVYNVLMDSQKARNRAIREKQRMGVRKAKNTD